ncbi:MAG: (deoxy)nucleoside triphosphate pyrophosphohydrolase [Sphingomonadaceae bacterium]|nr:MAG: (deoxy)nucleoside triphosphate pyrophosphohydrolase [Sphingomonadaceae bacterium]
MEKNFTPILVVAGALADGHGRWLMHRRPLGKHHAGLWEFPGGKVEPGELPKDALVRELDEEIGIFVDAEALAEAGFASSGAAGGQHPIVILLYTVERWEGQLHAAEGGELEWFTPLQIERLDKPPLDDELARQLFEK